MSSLGVMIQNVTVLSIILFISISVSIAFDGNFLSFIKKMNKMLWFLVMIAILQSIFSPAGRTLVAFGSFTILTTGGMTKGIEFILRMSIIIVSASIITSSPSRDIVQGLIQWKIPYEISFMVSVGIRFLPLLREEIKDVMTAIQLRGIELKKISLRKKIKLYSYLFTPVVAGSLIKAQKLSIAMETRAFRAYPKRTSYRILKMCWKDYVVISISIILTSIIVGIYI